MRATAILWSLWIFASAAVAAQSPQAMLNRAIEQFESGQFSESAATFDSVAGAVPSQAPHLWQRGIALYYAGRFADCREQFEAHRLVNPDDVENAAWHFLCVAKMDGVEKARAALLPVGPDSRPVMREIYQMFRGVLPGSAVLKAAGSDAAGRFYAHLYLGLHAEALGRKDEALQHMKEAASAEHARAGGYMHMVAVVHLRARSRP